MPSNVDIANRALSKVGGTPITSFTQGVRNSNVVHDIYDDLRDELLDYPWNFASVRAKLARSSTTPVFGWDYAYVLPSDWIRTRSAHDNVESLVSGFQKSICCCPCQRLGSTHSRLKGTIRAVGNYCQASTGISQII